MYIDTTPKRTRYTSPAPHTFVRTAGRSLGERKARMLNQLNAVNELLSVTRAHKARANLNETRNALLNSIAFIDAQSLRANPSY